MKLERITKVILPFDMRNRDPKKNYGIHATDIWFILKGPKGAVQYGVTLPCYLPHIEKTDPYMDEIHGFDVGYHSPVPMYEGQSSSKCEHTSTGTCYYDGSSLRADDWTKDIFSTIGRHPDEILWEKLEQEYKERFEE